MAKQKKISSKYPGYESKEIESDPEYSKEELEQLRREAEEEVMRGIVTGNEYFPKASYLEEDKQQFLEIKKIWDDAVIRFNPQLLNELKEVMTFYYYLKYKKTKMYNQIQSELLVIEFYEKYYIHKSGKQDASIEYVQRKLLEKGLNLDIEGIRNILKKYRKEKLKKKL